MARRKPTPAKARAEAIARTNGICAVSGCGKSIRDVDHTIPHFFTADDRPDNLTGMCVAHHREKTRQDIKAIAKVKRIIAKHNGLRKPKGTIRSAGFPKHLRRKFNGEVVAR
jgi:hypothetical protein